MNYSDKGQENQTENVRGGRSDEGRGHDMYKIDTSVLGHLSEEF